METSLFTFLILLTLCSIETGLAQTKPCGLDKFQCHDGSCIASELLCDGTADCPDHSDETRAECSKLEIMCPTYAFRCAYGACVDGDAPCNGIKDCIDNSDETLPSCTGATGSNTSDTSGCSTNEFRCNNGQCIDSVALCDGTADCADSSDETIRKCGSLECPQFVFRCAYGACIDGDLKCNGVQNCIDGSDEEPRLCRGTTPPSPQTPSTPPRPVTPTPHPVTQSPWTPKPRRTCTVPPQPQNGYWKLYRSQCPNRQDQQDCDVEQGVELEQGAYLIYTCNSGYQLRGSKDVFCGPEAKWLKIPVCVETKCKGLSSASREALCTYDDNWVSCDVPVLPRTTAKLSCRNSYRHDTTFLTRRRTNVRCNDKGEWDPEPIHCVPVCGVVTTSTTPLIVNGTMAKIVEFPWHATLYRTDPPSSEKQFICGATIIQAHLLITAAHCVYDEVTKRVDDPAKYYVATGNYFRDYDYPFHDPRAVKKGKVSKIHVICSYLGLEGNYAWDIAILELEQPFVFSALLVPICLDTSMYSDQTVLEVGNSGMVAGFGRTATGPSSFVLQSLTVPYIPLNQCKSSTITYDTEKFITIDKFCAGYSNGSSVCDGDSGGGLVFKTGGLWYLRGIVSVGVGVTISGGTRVCASHAYSLYTRVSNHMAWIQDVILKLETFKSYPSCPTIQ